MENDIRMAHLEDWSIITTMGGVGGDYLEIQGTVYDHPDFQNGSVLTPGKFVSFDYETMTGVSVSGRHWIFFNFIPNGNCRSVGDAIEFIEKNWMKQAVCNG